MCIADVHKVAQSTFADLHYLHLDEHTDKVDWRRAFAINRSMPVEVHR